MSISQWNRRGAATGTPPDVQNINKHHLNIDDNHWTTQASDRHLTAAKHAEYIWQKKHEKQTLDRCRRSRRSMNIVLTNIKITDKLRCRTGGANKSMNVIEQTLKSWGARPPPDRRQTSRKSMEAIEKQMIKQRMRRAAARPPLDIQQIDENILKTWKALNN